LNLGLSIPQVGVNATRENALKLSQASEKEAMKLSIMASEVMRFQTMTAVSRDEGMKLID